jgi:hypothetical protein
LLRVVGDYEKVIDFLNEEAPKCMVNPSLLPEIISTKNIISPYIEGSSYFNQQKTKAKNVERAAVIDDKMKIWGMKRSSKKNKEIQRKYEYVKWWNSEMVKW